MTPRLVLFDLDGTLYRGAEPIEGAAEVLASLRARGVLVRFLTNNSGQTRQDVVGKLVGMGIEAHEGEVFGSGRGTARYCAEAGFRTVFAVGEPGLVANLREAGLQVTNAGDDGWVLPESEPKRVDAVVVGICRHFDYAILNGALQAIRSGARFIATNPDPTYPMEGGLVVPGAGSIVAAVATCAETAPFVVGKPSPYLVHLALEAAGVRPDEAVVVGDRMDTDIASGVAAGCATHLVLTGVLAEAPPAQPHSPTLAGLFDRFDF